MKSLLSTTTAKYTMMLKQLISQSYAVFIIALIVNAVSCSNSHDGTIRKEMEVIYNPTLNVVIGTNPKQWTVKLTNLAFSQPFGPIFLVGHNISSPDLFSVGGTTSKELELLAEQGSPALLETKYAGSFGVHTTATVGSPTQPLLPGNSVSFQFSTSDNFPFISLATMAVNTNDCFAGFSKIKVYDGFVMTSPGYDAGTELNDEICTNIPGPACSEYNRTNPGTDGGEGFIHVHRGIHGIGDIEASIYDWRNPMLRVQIARVYQ
jgi:hypothetical protein